MQTRVHKVSFTHHTVWGFLSFVDVLDCVFVVLWCSAKKQIVPQAFRPSNPSQKPCGSGAYYGAFSKNPNVKTTDGLCPTPPHSSPSPTSFSLLSFPHFLLLYLLARSVFPHKVYTLLIESRIAVSSLSFSLTPLLALDTHFGMWHQTTTRDQPRRGRETAP